MADLTKLTDAQIETALAGLPGWSVEDGKLHREYKFADFIHAFGFMATAAVAIEAIGHHPEWFNVYHTVKIDLTTHDAGGITAWDVQLAEEFDRVAT